MNFFTKLFGMGKEKVKDLESVTSDILQGVIERGHFKLSFSLSTEKEEEKIIALHIELSGEDEGILTDRDGALLEALQFFVKRAVQHRFPEEFPNLTLDTKDGFREAANRSLIELVEKLRDRALDQGKSVYLRQLPPKDRKLVHQYLAEDGRVKSRSIGDGLYKKIKIYPIRKDEDQNIDLETAEADS